jgi:hypothetical protein
MKKPSHEANEAASRERAKIIKHLRSLWIGDDAKPEPIIQDIIAWIKGMPKRASKRPGGVGRK